MRNKNVELERIYLSALKTAQEYRDIGTKLRQTRPKEDYLKIFIERINIH